MKRFFVTAWLTVLCFLLFGNVHAWEVPSYLRVASGSRMWFTQLQGDLLQPDRTKLGLTENLGLNKDKLTWEFFATFRFDNIHVIRLIAEPSTSYDQSKSDSYLRVSDYRLGYDFDFYMTPQLLFGANAELVLYWTDSRVADVGVGNAVYNYSQKETRFFPTLGLHGTFYPIMDGMALRPNVSGRANWWGYGNLESWEWEAAAGVDIPVNRLWTWCLNGGYRFSHVKFKRDRDTLDTNRSGFFLETVVLF